MNNGYLSQYFASVAVKRLSAVEINPRVSHQHEFNGSRELKAVLETTERTFFDTTFLWIGEQNEAVSDEGSVTWYDARERHPIRSEYRLYFVRNSVMELAREGDTMFIARRTNNTLLIIITTAGSTIENQLYWLFGLTQPSGNNYELSRIDRENDHEIDFITRFILDEIGIEIEEPENELLDGLLSEFDGRFPVTSVFSDFARKTFRERIDEIEDPDGALIQLMNWEEKLFRRLERHVVSERLSEGFSVAGEQDVDDFISFSLSVHNRRKSRAGYAFEYHAAHIFQRNNLRFVRGAITENKSRPDFLFPGGDYYHNESFPAEYLTLLGAKTSCKDRWRQVLSEARRIQEKHLLTLEPGISENQTAEMQSESLRLVLPASIHTTYTDRQRSWLMTVRDFIGMVTEKQRMSCI